MGVKTWKTRELGAVASHFLCVVSFLHLKGEILSHIITSFLYLPSAVIKDLIRQQS